MQRISWVLLIAFSGTWWLSIHNPVPGQSPLSIKIEQVAYGGWKNNLRISNGEVELIATLDVGPRIIRYGFVGHQNVFHEYADQLGKSGEKDWQIRGGHRLWVAPEDEKRTYFPDNAPVKYHQRAGRIVLTPPPETPWGLQKEIEILLHPQGTRVDVFHRIRNVGKEPTQLAPWALSVMAPGGVEVIPLPPKQPHPQALLPNQVLVLWPYFDFTDPRYTFGKQVILLRHDSKRGPTKIGLRHTLGWAAYANRGTLFIKRFHFLAERTYPDFGVNYETFTNEDMLEMETLGPLVTLQPGEEVLHSESWELRRFDRKITNEDDALRLVVSQIR
ncbi:MAG: hypothetical protein RMI91_06930 [Gemmatales bacterium]|nr:DUF4380 domain-containing protein [Gemmatales bacterium]MDW7994371.1 hypothetical protein [Gemmatales bacterium]